MLDFCSLLVVCLVFVRARCSFLIGRIFKIPYSASLLCPYSSFLYMAVILNVRTVQAFNIRTVYGIQSLVFRLFKTLEYG